MRHIFLNDKRLIKKKKIGRENFYILEDDTQIKTKDILTIETECDCGNKRRLSKLHDFNLKKRSICNICKGQQTRDRQLGLKLSQETKDKIGKANKGKLSGEKNWMYKSNLYEHWLKKYGKKEADKRKNAAKLKSSIASSGENNGMYGKRITKEQERKRIKSLKNTLSNRSEEDKIKISKIYSESQQKIKEKNPDKYIENRKRAGKASILSQNRRFKMNKPEQIVYDQLKNLNLDFNYSVILNFKQFDFGNKEKRILLEVHGDYWHGNPNIYTSLNGVQVKNIKNDETKSKWAKEKGFILYVIWEDDILKGNFEVLEKIKKEHFNEV